MKKKVSIITIVILVIALIIESGLLISKKVGAVPKLSNGEEVLVEFNDGTKISINEIWNDMKNQYALQVVLDKIDRLILEKEYKDNESVERYLVNSEVTLRNNYESEPDMLTALANYGYNDLNEYLDSVKLTYMKSLATEDYAKSLVTEKEINNYYKNETVGDISAVHVLVKPASTSTTDLEEAKTKAEDLLKSIKDDIKSGTDSVDALKKYSNSEDTSIKYEDLGYFNKGEMEEAFETAAYKLKKNELSNEVIKTSYGYHIILVTDKKEKAALDEVREKIIETLAVKKQTDDTSIQTKALEELRKKNGVTINDSSLNDRYNRYINNLLNQSLN